MEITNVCLILQDEERTGAKCLTYIYGSWLNHQNMKWNSSRSRSSEEKNPHFSQKMKWRLSSVCATWNAAGPVWPIRGGGGVATMSTHELSNRLVSSSLSAFPNAHADTRGATAVVRTAWCVMGEKPKRKRPREEGRWVFIQKCGKFTDFCDSPSSGRELPGTGQTWRPFVSRAVRFSSSWSCEQTRCCSAHKHQISGFYFCLTHFPTLRFVLPQRQHRRFGGGGVRAGRTGLVKTDAVGNR